MGVYLAFFISDEFGCRTEVAVGALALVLVAFATTSKIGFIYVRQFLLGGKSDFFLSADLIYFSLIVFSLLLSLFEIFTDVFAAAAPTTTTFTTMQLVAPASPGFMFWFFVVFGLLA